MSLRRRSCFLKQGERLRDRGLPSAAKTPAAQIVTAAELDAPVKTLREQEPATVVAKAGATDTRHAPRPSPSDGLAGGAYGTTRQTATPRMGRLYVIFVTGESAFATLRSAAFLALLRRDSLR